MPTSRPSLALAAAVALAFSAVAPAAEVGTVHGHIRTPRTSSPIAGARVELVELHRETTTAPDGSYSFADVEAGSYTLRTTAASGATASQVVVVSGSRGATAEIVLAGVESGLGTITVNVDRYAEARSRAVQYAAPNLIDVVSIEEIRKLPDISAAEAVRRLPGVSAENDTGEARFINIRGLDADLNGTTFAGVRMPPTNPSSPLSGGRAVAFDTIPSGLLGSVTVTKTNVPEMDAEALGGTIELTPRRLGAGDPAFVSGRVGSGYEPLRSTKIIDLELSGGTRFGGGSFGSGPFSVVGSIAYYEDRRGIDDLEKDYLDNTPTNPDKSFADLQQRYYNGYHRRRLGAGGEFAFQPDEHNRWYLDVYQTGYSESNHKDFQRIDFAGNASADPNNPNLITDQVDAYRKSATDHKEDLRARLISLGGKNDIGSSVLDYRVSYTEGTYVVSHDIGWEFLTPAGDGATITYDVGQPNWPSYKITPSAASGAINANRLDPTQYTLNGPVSTGTESDKDKETSAAINWLLPVSLFAADKESVKVGASGRWRDKVLAPNSVTYDNVPNVNLSGYVTNEFITFYKNHYTNGFTFDFDKLSSYLNSGAFSRSAAQALADLQSNQATFQRNKEDVYAAYFQYEATFGNWGLLAGARVEHTSATYGAYAVDNTASNPVQGFVDDRHSYTNFFPTVQGKYVFEPTLIARGTVSSSIGRPGFNQITSAIQVNSRTDGSPTNPNLTIGNPALKPVTAYSLDLSIEKYLPNGGILSAGVFDKELSNYVVSSVEQLASTPPPITPIPAPVYAQTFRNINKARVYGIELAWEQHFNFLPGFWQGFGAGANYTWVHSRAEVSPGIDSQLPSTAEHTANVALFYDRGPLSVRLAGYYTGEVLYNLGSSPSANIYQSPRKFLDFGSSYALTPHSGIYFNAKNLTNDAMRYVERSEDRPIQREFYGVTLQAGLTFQF